MATKCPICGEFDYIRFTFAGWYKSEGFSEENPSDTRWVDVCPNWHVRDEQGEEVKPHD